MLYLLVEAAHIQMLLRDGHTLQILQVARGLEISAAYQQIDRNVLLLLYRADQIVYFLQLTVRTSFDRNLHHETRV